MYLYGVGTRRYARIAEYFSSVSYRVQLNLLYRHKVCILYSSYNFNQCLSPLTLWVRILLISRCTRYNITCDQVCQWLATDRWFSPGTPVSSTNKTNRHDNWNIVESGVKSVCSIKYTLAWIIHLHDAQHF
jgi:hypothetical protein